MIGAISQRTGSVHGSLAFAAIALWVCAALLLFLPKKTWVG
jgi:hypothetical protein